MKKLSLLLVIALMLFSFVGCSGNKSGGTNEVKTLKGTAKGFGGDVTVMVM